MIASLENHNPQKNKLFFLKKFRIIFDMLNLVFRKATLIDLENLLSLEHSCFIDDRISRGEFRALLKKTTADILIAESANQLIAAAVLYYRKHSTIARLYSFAVHPTHRRTGIASALNSFMENEIKSRNANQLILEVRQDNISAINFYLKTGYKQFGTYPKFYEDGTDAFRMKKDLT